MTNPPGPAYPWINNEWVTPDRLKKMAAELLKEGIDVAQLSIPIAGTEGGLCDGYAGGAWSSNWSRAQLVDAAQTTAAKLRDLHLLTVYIWWCLNSGHAGPWCDNSPDWPYMIGALS
jgi:hypothetical protein